MFMIQMYVYMQAENEFRVERTQPVTEFHCYNLVLLTPTELLKTYLQKVETKISI